MQLWLALPFDQPHRDVAEIPSRSVCKRRQYNRNKEASSKNGQLFQIRRIIKTALLKLAGLSFFVSAANSDTTFLGHVQALGWKIPFVICTT